MPLFRYLAVWSEDKNFFLVDFNAKMQGKPGLKEQPTYRLGSTYTKNQILGFDSDGGYGDGIWTLVENRWAIKSNAVMPDSQTDRRRSCWSLAARINTS